MEKRKLAQIPREEATDEMVRFAERAAGTHIVTTRDIEKDLLMMTFYPIDKLKKGEKSAQLRTFFSKNDYISQDLTAERVKWLTAAFDRWNVFTCMNITGIEIRGTDIPRTCFSGRMQTLIVCVDFSKNGVQKKMLKTGQL